MPDELILTIDQGTTNTKALLVDRLGKAVFKASRPLQLLQPQRGFVEQDPVEIWNSVREVAIACAQHADNLGCRIAGIAITNQRETALAWRQVAGGEGASPAGNPLVNAISWQCRRSAGICNRLADHGARIQEVTGLPLDPLVTASKWAWLLENDWEYDSLLPGLRLGTVDSWLIANLTGGEVHATDHSNASRTALLNLETLKWDDEMLQLFGIPASALPTIQLSSGWFGACTSIPELAGIPIVAAIGDSHAALAGHGHYGAGTVKATYGTGSSLMTLTEGLVSPVETLARTVAWSTREGVQYALEGNIAMTGSAVQWVGEFLGLPNPTADTVALAGAVPDSAGVVFVPAMVGLGAPYWDKGARGMISNLERSHTSAHLARAALDAIVFQIADVFFGMEQAAGVELPVLLADGGASSNDGLMQFQADVLMRSVQRAANEELSAVGAAWLGGLALGWWSCFRELAEIQQDPMTFAPKISTDEACLLRKRWSIAVGRARLPGEEAA